jgi:hypothetical protein
VRLVPRLDMSERKKLARRLSHWYSRFVPPSWCSGFTGREYWGSPTKKASDGF